MLKDDAHSRVIRLMLCGLKENHPNVKETLEECFKALDERDIFLGKKDIKFILSAGYLLALKDVLTGLDSTDWRDK